MWNMIWPVLIVVAANTLYNISAKSTPEEINSFASLAISYVVAAVCSLILYFVTAENRNIFAEIGKTNWSTLALGAAIVGLEFGYICIYRAGWKVSVASLVANISLACVLLIVGLLMYKEVLSLRQAVGMGLCAVGMILMVK
ncbi:MAG: hypothetical protein E7554_00205 [Ruminococcaceae bacterium]|nr:hypothetical protein [Oscillospiraceae bacterium]